MSFTVDEERLKTDDEHRVIPITHLEQAVLRWAKNSYWIDHIITEIASADYMEVITLR